LSYCNIKRSSIINDINKSTAVTIGDDKSTKELIKIYSQPDWRRSVWQLVNSIVPYIILMVAMYYSLEISYWLTLTLAIPTAGFLVRIFIIFHDCGHGSFFKSHKANTIVGYFTGIINYAPYHGWRYNHAQHHATCSDLDRRGIGDVWTLTKQEYLDLSAGSKLGYRLYRHPFVLFVLGPIWLFLINHRFSPRDAKKRERRSVWLTNLGIIIMVATLSLFIGIKAYLLIQLPVLLIGGMSGIWLFYVQHQYEDVYWNRHDAWDFQDAALEGSSFYKLPAILQWFTGNIGFHHVHHLNARIPNYNLQRCHEKIALFREVKPLRFFTSLKSLRFRLYDEELGRMIGFKSLRTSS
jgi:omega-6 fatty acid desaturase (delta-12 desaturase)